MKCKYSYNDMYEALTSRLNRAQNKQAAKRNIIQTLAKEDLQQFGQSSKKATHDITTEELNTLLDIYNQIGSTEEDLGTMLSWITGRTIELEQEPLGSSPDSMQDMPENSTYVNFIDSAYGDSSAKTNMLRRFNSGIIKAIIVDLSENREIIGNTAELNTQLTKLQEELYSEVAEYVKEKTGKTLPKKLFATSDSPIKVNRGLAEIDKLIEHTSDSELKALFNLNQNPRTLSNWKKKSIIKDSVFDKKLRAYNAYFILKNFDSLLADQYGSFIKNVKGEPGQLTSSNDQYEFYTGDDLNNVQTWQQEDLYTKSAYDLIPKHLQRFIEALEIIDFGRGDNTVLKDGRHTGQYLTKNHLTYFIKQIKKQFRNNNTPVVSIVLSEGEDISKMTPQVLLSRIRTNPQSKLDINSMPKTVAYDLILQLRDRPTINNVKVLTLGNIVNNIRLRPEIALKTLFEVRKNLNTQFKTKIEKRIFQNLYHYLFAENNSLYSSSRFLYGELSSLFDTMSIVDHTQYDVDSNGYLTVKNLTPENRDLIRLKLRRRFNTQFVTGELDRYKKKYGGELNDVDDPTTKSSIREVSFAIKDSTNKIGWQFNYHPMTDTWDLWRPNSVTKQLEQYDASATEKVNGRTRAAERARMSEQDLRGLNDFIKDIIGYDFETNKEQWEALLDITNKTDRNMESPSIRADIIRQALYTVLDVSVRIYANALMFRQSSNTPKLISRIDQLEFGKQYKVTLKKNNEYEQFYTTKEDTPYERQIEKDEGKETVPDINRIKKEFGRTDIIKHIKQKNLETYVQDPDRYIVEELPIQAYKQRVSHWFGKDSKVKLSPNSVYQGIDLVSSSVSEKLDDLVELEALITGSTFNNQVTTAERTKITVGGNSMLFAEKQTRMQEAGRNYHDPMAILNEYFNEGYKGNSYSREVKNGSESKQNKDFNFKENFHSCFVADFLLPLYKEAVNKEHGDVTVRFTDSVNSDKPNVPKDHITGSRIMKIEDVKKRIKESLGDAYRATFQNVLDDCSKLVKEYKRLAGEEVPLSPKENFREFNAWCKTHEITPIAQLGKMVKTYNIAHREDPIAFYEGIHYTIDETNTPNKNNFYVNFAFVEALNRYTVCSADEIKQRRDTLKLALNNEELTQEAKETLTHQLNNLEKFFINKTAVEDTTQLTNNSMLDLSWNTIVEGLKSAEYRKVHENSQTDFFQDFIDYSNKHFVNSLLKNDVSLDMKAFEEDLQLTDCIKELARVNDMEESEFKKLWMSPYSERLVFGILYDSLGDTISNPISKNKPLQLASREDLIGLSNDKEGTIDYTNPSFSLNKELYYKGERVYLAINPVLEQFNLNHYYWTSLSNLATTGTHIWSEAKKSTRTLEEEGAKWFDSNKRKVINSATSTQFRLGSIFGVPTNVNIAVIDDIRAICSGILGDTPSVKPYDGATFVNPFMYYWENYSLNNAITGITKKPIYEFYDEHLMAGGLIKTASFALTNEEMRNSDWSQRMMWKLTNFKWKDLTGEGIDLTLGQRQNNDIVAHLDENDKYQKPHCYKDYVTYENSDGSIITKKVIKTITGFEKIAGKKNAYIITTEELDEHTGNFVNGSKTEFKKIIDSNYSFWEALGGFNSVTWNSEAKRFEDSEKSIETVAKYAGKIRFKKQGNAWFQDLSRIDENEKDLLETDDRLIFTPLREANIHYLVTKGAIKKGAANINSTEDYFSDDDLNFYKIRLLQAGIQLDPEHEADQSEVSLMTQVMSGLSDRGYSTKLAGEVYKALADLSQLAIRDYWSAFNIAYKKGDRAKIQELVSGLLLDEIMQTKNSPRTANIAKAITEQLVEAGKRGEDLNFEKFKDIYPFSDGSIFELLQTTVTASLNKKAIREKMFGSLSVLRPSHEIHKIYGTKRLGEIIDFYELWKMQETLNGKLLDFSDIQIGRCYTVVSTDKKINGKLINIKDSDYYYKYKEEFAGKDCKLIETIYSDGETYNGDVNTLRTLVKQNNGQFKYYKLIYAMKNKKKKPGDDQPETITKVRIKRIGTVDDIYDLEGEKLIGIQRINLYGRNLASYNVYATALTKNGASVKFNRYDLKVVQEAVYDGIKKKIDSYISTNNKTRLLATDWYKIFQQNKVEKDKQDFWKTVYKKHKLSGKTDLQYEKELQNQLTAISKGRKVEFVDSNMKVISGEAKSYNVSHFEAILPMIYATQFGIRRGDSLNRIRQDLNFFFKRNLENYLGTIEPDSSAYDICFKRADGKHIYIKVGSGSQLSSLGFINQKISKFKDPDDNIFRMSKYNKGKKVHALASMNDEVYYNSNIKTEVITTDDVDFYLKNLNYTGLHFSSKIKNNTVLCEKIKNSLKEQEHNNKAVYVSDILEERGMEGYLEEQEKLVTSINEYLRAPSSQKEAKANTLLASTNPLIKMLNNTSKQQHASFIESLKFTVARIPAQGMQSFMAMDIVGFNNTGVNDCYVSAEQIRLQGSDYDVDKATFLGHAFTKSGIFIKWSPFFKLMSADQITESKVLPFPTGIKGTGVEIKKGIQVKSDSIDWEKYTDLLADKTKEDNTDQDEVDKKTNKKTEDTSTKYKLKNNRNQLLLAQLINEINEVGKAYFEKNTEETDFKLYYSKKNADVAKALLDIVNTHNLYINKMPIESRHDVLKNFIASRVFSISEDPINALVGQTSVDVVSEPLKKLGNKSPIGLKVADSRPGDASNQWKALEANHTGKDVIGITASNGVKCYFAMSYDVNNAILHGRNLNKFWFNNVSFTNRETGEVKEYHFLANPFLDINNDYKYDPNYSKNKQFKEFKDRMINSGLREDQLKWLYERYLNQSEWAGSYISGILTLATDNAKELQLASLNAGKDLAGLYLYGLQIGVPLNDIYETMTSPTAQVLSRIMKSDIFAKSNLPKQLDRVIKFLKEDVNFKRKNNDSDEERWDDILPRRKSSRDKLLADINEYYKKNNLEIEGLKDTKTFDDLIKLKGSTFNQTIIELTKRGEFDKYILRLKHLKNKILDFNDYRDSKQKENLDQRDTYRGYSWSEVNAKNKLDRILHHAVDIYEIAKSHQSENLKSDIFADMNNIKMLNDGFSELGILRQLLGLNQGIKTVSADKLKFYEDFANIIIKRKKSIGSYRKAKEAEDRIDFQKFFTNTEYRNRKIQEYEDIKQSINPLLIVTELPHFNAYLEAAFIDYAICGVSSKFRLMTNQFMPIINREFKPNNAGQRARYTRRALDFIDGLITNKWLLEQKAIKLPKGSVAINPDGTKKIMTTDFYIELGTQEGNATFLYWMNQEVIPRLKEGKLYGENLKNGKTILTRGGDESGANLFLRDLIPNQTNKTYNRNNMQTFSLPIDMIPKSDTDADRLSRYKVDFQELRNYAYQINESDKYGVIDLFFYYNLINFKNRGGDQSLTSLFDSLIQTGNSPILKNYISFVSQLDREYDFQEGIDYSRETFLKYIAPTNEEVGIKSAGNSKIPYLWYLDRNTMKYSLLRYDSEPANEDVFGRNNFIESNIYRPEVFPVNFRQGIELNKEQKNLTLGDLTMDLKVTKNRNNFQLEISNVRAKTESGDSPDVSKLNEKIIGEKLNKFLKVSNIDGQNRYSINQVSLLIYLSSKRRKEC